MSYLERWRNKSREAKSSIAFLGAIVTTLSITVIWGSSLPARFGELSGIAEVGIVDDPVLADLVAQTKTQVGAVAEILPKDEGGAVQSGTPRQVPGAVKATSTSSTTKDTSFATSSVTELEKPEATSIPIVPKPKVILIGTTTSKTDKKNEE